MPVPVLEGDELGATDAGDWLPAGEAPFRKEFAKTFGAVRFVVATGEASTRQARLAVGAGEALPVPGLVFVGNSTTGDYLKSKNKTNV